METKQLLTLITVVFIHTATLFKTAIPSYSPQIGPIVRLELPHTLNEPRPTRADDKCTQTLKEILSATAIEPISGGHWGVVEGVKGHYYTSPAIIDAIKPPWNIPLISKIRVSPAKSTSLHPLFSWHSREGLEYGGERKVIFSNKPNNCNIGMTLAGWQGTVSRKTEFPCNG